MKGLITKANVDAPDDVYEALIAMHDGLDANESAIVNARMILILANHIGDVAILRAAAKLARGDRKGAPKSAL